LIEVSSLVIGCTTVEGSMQVTLREVAKKTGLSLPAISQILNHRGKYSTRSRELVFEAVKALNYQPNTFAKAMRQKHFGAVALLLSGQQDGTFFSCELLDGIQEALKPRDMHLALTRLPDEKLTSEGYVPKILRELMVDGLLIKHDTRIPARMTELVESNRIPSVWMNVKRSANCVHPDDFRAGCFVTEHLLHLGHRRIAYADQFFGAQAPAAHYSTLDRYRGYEETMKQAGLAAVDLRMQEQAPLSRIAQAKRALQASPKPTALVAYSNFTAYAYTHAAMALGLRVPEDFSVVTFGERMEIFGGLELTTHIVPDRKMGRSSVEMLLERIANPLVQLPPRVEPFDGLAGYTCQAPRSGE
jgi:LacI family transcriptional regulator